MKGSDVFISVAAVADWKAKKISGRKLKKLNGRTPTLEFEENPDILTWVAAQKNAPFCVGFAAESENLIQFGACTAGTNALTHFAVVDTASGAVAMMISGALSATLNVSAGIQPQFAAGALSVSAD